MKNYQLLWLCLLAALLSCSKKENTPEVSRSFYMAVTPWPADFTAAELDTSYAFVKDHCDMVSQHFDDGIPYEEAYNNLPMPVDFQQDAQVRKTKTASGKKIFLSVSALDLSRKQKAAYYRKSTQPQSVKDSWTSFAVNDPRVITAYINYVSWLADYFQPSFINFGVESNSLQFDPLVFQQYKSFIAQVYQALKIKYPGTPLMVSFMVDESAEGFSFAQQLLPYTDIIALSAYPYITVSSSVSGNTDPALFPANYFERFINMAGKPWGFAETGYTAENLVVPSYSLNKQGTPAWQKAYLEKICGLAAEYNAKFLVWFCSKDYDAGNITLQSLGLYQDLFALWQDTGLKDQVGNPRPAYETWKQWFSKPYKN